jgi:hypothetical protein
LKAKVAWSEVKLLVVGRVIGDMHLPILAEYFSVGAENYRGVVIKPGGSFFEE